MSRVPGPEDGDRPDGPMTDEPGIDEQDPRGPDEVTDPNELDQPGEQPPSVPGEHAPGTQVDRHGGKSG